MMEYSAISVGLVLLVTLTPGVHADEYVKLNVAVDRSQCSDIANTSLLIQYTLRRFTDTVTGAMVRSYCDLGCVNERWTTCGVASRKTTYSLVMKVSGIKQEEVTVIRLPNGTATVSPDTYSFLCAEPSIVAPGSNYCEEHGGRWEAYTSDPRQSPTSQHEDNLGLKVGLPVALAALAALSTLAGLLYRKLRKKNGVGDEGDMSNILAGTPIVPIIEDAPNSVAPAGTS